VILRVTFVLAALVAAGCGGSTSRPDSAGYGTMTPYIAASRAQEAAEELVSDSSSPYYRKSLDYIDVRKGRNQAGGKAWVGVFAAPKGQRVCIAVWIDPADIAHWLWDFGLCRGATA
jgi:hypothetical protein